MTASIKPIAGRPPSKTRGKTRDKTSDKRFVLRLYVAGATLRSTQAILDARRICDHHLAGQYRLEVIDIHQQPLLAIEGQIVAVPTLVRHSPGPARRLVGDLSDVDRVLRGLELAPRAESPVRALTA